LHAFSIKFLIVAILLQVIQIFSGIRQINIASLLSAPMVSFLISTSVS